MSDPQDRAYNQLWHELFDDQGHRRGCFVVTANRSHQHLEAWLQLVPLMRPRL